MYTEKGHVRKARQPSASERRASGATNPANTMILELPAPRTVEKV